MLKRILVYTTIFVFVFLVMRRSSRITKLLEGTSKAFREIWLALVTK